MSKNVFKTLQLIESYKLLKLKSRCKNVNKFNKHSNTKKFKTYEIINE